MKEIYYEERIIENKKFQETVIEQCKFADCTFKDCTFEAVKIIGCLFVNCTFQHCTIVSLTSKHSEIRNATFQKCNLIGVHWYQLLPAGRYAHPIEKFEDCHLKYNSFIEMCFRKFDFSGNMIQESIFEDCDLADSNFQNCHLNSTQIIGCDLQKSDFRDARGYVIDIVSNKMKYAKFSYPEVLTLLNTLELQIDL